MHLALLPVAAAAAVALFAASAPTPERSAPVPATDAYAACLAPYVGKAFFLSADWTVATEKTRTLVVPDGQGEFTLAAVGADFACFEGRTERACVPLATLRAILGKSGAR
jgi:hypothetical protein